MSEHRALSAALSAAHQRLYELQLNQLQKDIYFQRAAEFMRWMASVAPTVSTLVRAFQVESRVLATC